MQYDDKVMNRMKRIEGQMRGVMRMMQEEKECKEIVSQMAAVRNALDRTMALIVSTNLEECVRQQMESGEDTSALIEEAVNLIVKSR